MVEGILKYYPQIKEQLEIIYVDFQKPRQAVIDMLGTENQGCPVLIIEKKQDEKADTSYFQSSGDKKFVNNLGDISNVITSYSIHYTKLYDNNRR